MQKQIRTKNGKSLNIPVRMFRSKDLKNMDIEFVEDKIYFNKSDDGNVFPEIRNDVKEHMCVLNYADCSDDKYSDEKMISVVKKQIEQNSDFIVIPSFKNETEYDIAKKLELSGKLKALYDKDIIFEISYKATPQSLKRVIEQSNNFDILGIFYGVHYGRQPSFIALCRKIFEFKQRTGKKVFCIAVPMVFSGDSYSTNSQLFPIWELISDGWVRNWKRGGGSNEIRLIDFLDLKNKNFNAWCEKHNANELVRYVGVTVSSLFRKGVETQKVREEYTRMLIDEVVNEVSLLTPYLIWKYLSEKTPEIYHTAVLRLYNQRLTHQRIRESVWSSFYSNDEIELIEKALMRILDPIMLGNKIQVIESLVSKEEKIPISILLKEIEKT